MLGNLLAELRSTSKPSEKYNIIKKHDSEFLKRIIHSTYDPFRIFHIRLKKSEIPTAGNKDIIEIDKEIYDLLNFCEESNSPKQNREAVIKILSLLNEGSQELLVGILNKNWKAGIGRKHVLKLFPHLISRFDVQLSNTYKVEPVTDFLLKDYDIPRWLWSYKLDGLRCIALRESSDEIYDKGRWTLYSRKGKKFLTVDHLKDQLEELYDRFGWTFFDGELYKHGIPFEEIQGAVMGFKRGPAPHIEYHVFIAGKAEWFLNGINENDMIPLGGESEEYSPDIKFVTEGFITPVELESKMKEAFSNGYEGLMLRDPDQLYDYKRSNALLKLKADKREGEIISDCVVESIDIDDFPVIEDGQMSYEKLLVRLWVKQKDDIICKVGSGFGLNFRRKYTVVPEELEGKTIEVKHQGWGSNGRMRFPRLHRVREDL